VNYQLQYLIHERGELRVDHRELVSQHSGLVRAEEGQPEVGGWVWDVWDVGDVVSG
jgi:hypothetical protein